MFNPITICIPINKSDHPNHVNRINTNDYAFIPEPNVIEYLPEYFEIQCPIMAKTYNINPSNQILLKFTQEIQLEYDVRVMWETDLGEDQFSEIDSITFPSSPLFEEEGYIIKSLSQELIIQSYSLHGLFNALQTLHQILINGDILTTKKTLERFFYIRGLKIEDCPKYTIRGFSDDIARGQAPTVENLKKWLDLASSYKLNYYFLYLEDMFICSKHPEIARDRSAYSPDDLRELDKYAKTRFITLVPIFETLGHMDNFLIHEEYEDLGEFPGSHCLALANGNIYPFLRDYLYELAPCFNNPFFHIGFDEPYDLGHGRSKDLIHAVGKAGVIKDHYRRLSDILHETGKKRVILYHDLLIKHKNFRKYLDKNSIVMYWNYKPSSDFKNYQKLLGYDFPVITSSATWGWSRHFPDFQKARKNITSLIQYTEKYTNKGTSSKNSSTLLGHIVSAWGDCSFYNFRANNIYALMIGSFSSWTEGELIHHSFIDKICKLFFRIKKPLFIGQFSANFRKLAVLNKYIDRGKLGMKRSFFDEFFRNPFHSSKRRWTNDEMKEIDLILTQLSEFFTLFEKLITKNLVFFSHLKYSKELFQFLYEKEKFRYMLLETPKEINDYNFQYLDHYINMVYRLKSDFQSLWCQASKKHMIQRPISRFDQLIGYYRDSYKNTESLSSLNSFFSLTLPSKWIWSRDIFANSQPRYFRYSFHLNDVPPAAKIQVIAGNLAYVYVNGIYIGRVMSRYSLSIQPLCKNIRVFDISDHLNPGKNTIAIEAYHFLNSRAAINVFGQIAIDSLHKSSKKNMVFTIQTDDTWVYCTKPFDSLQWTLSDYLPSKDTTHRWKSAKERGCSPKFNGELKKVQLLQNEQTIPEDRLWYHAHLYYFVQMLSNSWIAKIVRWLKG